MEWKLNHGIVRLPAFFPDGTRAVVRCVDSLDLEDSRVPGLVVNTYHLMTHPGVSVVKAIGGAHALMGWNRPILTDSGGFQVFSLIKENPKRGTVRPDGARFRREDGSAVNLTPESCVRMQFALGADAMMCLDECTDLEASRGECERAVERTVKWARMCREELDRQVGHRRGERPMLLAIVQGGAYPDLRGQCADALKSMRFDGYGFGGWPLDGGGRLDTDILRATADSMPEGLPKYAMGIGMPEAIAACVDMGYNLFDCVVPSREARHNRLYIFNEKFDSVSDIDPRADGFYRRLYPLDEEYWRDPRPLSKLCDCLCCRRYSRAYLSHLYRIGDPLAYRLGTMHNLRFYTRLMELLRGDG
ncbi:MAG: tRNA guanosine(34) transglycosylase Tgt [Oscillospiraceae bacterium]|jgi:queuine tRNA-ribosyltransferase|nr:tRNA guanosine(34) transglycosylase Tgt [Oscillospiraceae bacterium]